jgi:hypothetical protein
VALVMGASITTTCGAFAAGKTAAKPTPVNLAGRWTGNHFGYGRVRAPAPGANPAAGQTLAYDIVACGDAWCGIAVTDEASCGAVALKLKPDTARNRKNAFSGNLELAKGTAAYVVEAWYQAPDEDDADKTKSPVHLSFIGDTGTELLLMRRSFPFQAELTRTGDAVCTLEKAVS